VTVSVGTRDTQGEAFTYTTAQAPNDAGFVPVRAQGRYHRARMTISGGWDKALGIDIEAREIGRR